MTSKLYEEVVVLIGSIVVTTPKAQRFCHTLVTYGKERTWSNLRFGVFYLADPFFNDPCHDAFELILPICPCNGGLALKCRPQDRL